MSELEIMLELAYLYGVHNKDIQEVEEIEDFVEKVKEQAAYLPIWFARYNDTSPLEVLHDYFKVEILGQ